MLYLTFHIDQPAVATIKSWQQQMNQERPAQQGGAGGAYTFAFSPAPGGCRVTVTRHGGAGPGSAVPLELELGHCLHVEEDPNRLEDAFRWRHPQYYGALPEGGDEVGVEEIVFWIDGHLLRRLEGAGWTAERAGEYTYSFRPNSAGADVWVSHRESGETVELVRDAPAV